MKLYIQYTDENPQALSTVISDQVPEPQLPIKQIEVAIGTDLTNKQVVNGKLVDIQ